MTIPNYDHEIEKKYHPENFAVQPPLNDDFGLDSFFIPIKVKGKRGSAKEARSIQHKRRNQL